MKLILMLLVIGSLFTSCSDEYIVLNDTDKETDLEVSIELLDTIANLDTARYNVVFYKDEGIISDGKLYIVRNKEIVETYNVGHKNGNDGSRMLWLAIMISIGLAFIIGLNID